MTALDAGTTTVRYDVSDGVARLTLARPAEANAVDLPTARALGAAVEAIEADDDVKVVLLTGEGKRFCAGGDVAAMVAAEDRPAFIAELADALDGALRRLDALDKPVVVAVQGAVAGAGLAVMLSGDVVVAEASTKFVMAYPGIGMTPDVGVSWLLPRAVGQQRALELALTGKVLDGAEAREWGLVTEVVESGAAERAAELAARMAAGPAWALGQARRLIRRGAELTREEAGAEESRTITRAVATPDATRLLQAFVTKG